eukprot:scaffold429967_cov18-Prasinocladus_malaysianus.AAC.1
MMNHTPTLVLELVVLRYSTRTSYFLIPYWYEYEYQAGARALVPYGILTAGGRRAVALEFHQVLPAGRAARDRSV